MLAGTEVSLPLLRQKASSIYQELHRRITALEEALRAASSSHPLLSTSNRSVSVGSEPGHLTSPNHGVLPCSDRQSGQGAVDSLSGYSHLIVEEDPKRSKYYGAASSVYLTVSHFSIIIRLQRRLMLETLKYESTIAIDFDTNSAALIRFTYTTRWTSERIFWDGADER